MAPPEAQRECRNYFDGRLDTAVVTLTSMMAPIPVSGSPPNQGALTLEDDDTGFSTSTKNQETQPAEAECSNGSSREENSPESNSETKIEELESRIESIESEIENHKSNDTLTEDDVRRILHQESSEEILHEDGDGDHSNHLSIETLSDVSGIGPASIDRLQETGYQSIQSIKSASITELSDVDQTGDATAEKLRNAAIEISEQH